MKLMQPAPFASDALASGTVIATNDHAAGRGDDHHAEEQRMLGHRVSDEALEAASGAPILGVPTVFHVTYCFGCPR
ncbi:MAG TPA: hypothetical protein VEJ37_09620 [Xanthobacteraceae bacterium]|nr:hypothetical protein [Xanthobacteraceae bacterium]